ncbi:MAG: hypothetical protein ABIQ95_06205, partial [Bdellovibrionia bacterium]
AIVLGSKLYLADSSNSRILVWNNIPTSNTQGADSVIGQTSLFSANLNTVSLSSSTLNNPFALSSQDIYLIIADRDNNRVLFIVP